MKKIFTVIAIATLLTSCGGPKYAHSSLSIIAPTGAPALAFYRYGKDANFETNSDPATGILPLMVAGKKDIVVLPTNAGMQAILNKKAEYKIAATVSFGNFYLVSMGNDDNNEMDVSDNILLFQKGNVPDKIFHYIYGDDLNAGIHYVKAVSDAASAAISCFYVDEESGEKLAPNYVLLAQPVLTTVLSKNNKVATYADIQVKYQEKSNNLPLFQASVFVKNSVDKTVSDSLLESLKSDVDNCLKKPSVFKTYLKGVKDAKNVYGVEPEQAEVVTKNNNGMGLGFEYAKDNKEAIANFLKLFNIEGYNEEVYYE